MRVLRDSDGVHLYMSHNRQSQSLHAMEGSELALRKEVKLLKKIKLAWTPSKIILLAST